MRVATSYEYGIAQGDNMHRSNMTKSEAEAWMVEWVQMTGRRAPFKVIRRPVGEWETVEDDERS